MKWVKDGIDTFYKFIYDLQRHVIFIFSPAPLLFKISAKSDKSSITAVVVQKSEEEYEMDMLMSFSRMT